MDPHGIHSSVTMSRDKLVWDGEQINHDEFRRRLTLAPSMNPVLHILFDPTGASSCHQAEQVRDKIDRFADCRGKGRCGLGKLNEFKKFRDGGGPGT